MRETIPREELQSSRRSFLIEAARWSTLLAAYPLTSVPLLAESLTGDTRVAGTLVADKGFAAVRKVGDGLYATISDTSKGLQAMCNGGFLVGKDSALLVEGFGSPAGAVFQHETLRPSARVRCLQPSIPTTISTTAWAIPSMAPTASPCGRTRRRPNESWPPTEACRVRTERR